MRSGMRRPLRRTTAPPTTSEWPPTYFVVEWTTASAPSSSGLCRTGVAKVLSTTSRPPARWVSSATAAMSVTVRKGFDGVSTHTSAGRLSPMARAAPSASVRSTASEETPSAGLMAEKSLWVPPYTSVEWMTWSPARVSRRMSVSSALMPDGKAKPRSAPSNAASAAANAFVVGLPQRPYSNPSLRSPGLFWMWVEATWIGGTTSPVTGSGSKRAWTARVANEAGAAGRKPGRGPGEGSL